MRKVLNPLLMVLNLEELSFTVIYIYPFFFSDAWRRRRRRRIMGENGIPVSADVSQEEIPENVRQKIIAAFTDQETSEDEPEEYNIHPKHAI